MKQFPKISGKVDSSAQVELQMHQIISQSVDPEEAE